MAEKHLSPAMTATEVAAELGRSSKWLAQHRHRLERDGVIPSPMPGSVPLMWNRAQVYACLDRRLPPRVQSYAAAFRAALAAGDEQKDAEDARQRLNQKFGVEA